VAKTWKDWNTSSGKEMPAPDTKESKQKVIPNKDNSPRMSFSRMSENKAKRRNYE
jgi:hypothetical protein